MNSNEKLEDKIELLSLYNKLKREVYRSLDLDSLLNNVVRIIANHSMYDSAWIIKTTSGNISNFYHSDNYDYKDNIESLRTSCFEETLSVNRLLIIGDKEDYCKKCHLKFRHDNITVFSVPLRYKGEDYGVLLANVHKKWADDIEHQDNFVTLGEDISYAIYNKNVEQELKREKEELKFNKTKLQLFINTMEQAVIIFDTDMNTTFVSDRIRALFKLEESVEFNTSTFNKIFSIDDIERIDRNFKTLISGKIDKLSSVYKLRSSNNEDFLLQVNSTVIKDINGNIDSIASLVEDISERKKKEQFLKLVEDKYATIFKRAPNGISILDSKGYILEVNDKESNLLGYRKEELIGKHISTFFKKEYLQKFAENFKSFLRTGTQDIDVEIVKKDGTLLTVSRTARAIYNEKKEIEKIIVITNDNTDITNANNKLHIFSEVLKQSPSIITLTDLNGDISYVNKRFEEVTGYKSEEVLGNNPRLLKSSYHSKKFYLKIWNKLSKGEVWSGRIYNKRKDGTKYWEQTLISPFYNLNNEIVGYIKAAEEINILVELEARLEESNDRYHNIFDLVTVPIMIHKDGLLLDLNNAALKFSKAKSKTDMLGTNIMQYVRADYRKTAIDRIALMKKEKKSAPMVEQVFINIKGEERNVEVTSSPIQFKGEQAFIVIFEDITERKRWVQKLKDNELKFRNVFEINPNPISISRIDDGMLLEVNSSYIDITGYTKEEIIGHTVSELNLYEDIERRNELVSKLQQNGSFINEEANFRVKDGSIKTAIVSAIIMEIEDVNYLLFVFNDISERKSMEVELVKAKEQAVENDNLKTAFLANMSHEIRTPLNAIIGFSDLLKEDDISKQEELRYIDIIQSKGDELLLLMNDIIDMSKIEAGAIEFNIEKVNAGEVLASISKSFNVNIINRKNKEIKFIIDELPSAKIYVLADQFRLIQVLNNLINNAIKFTVEGEVRVKVKENDIEVCFEVIDTGIGIPNNKLNYIFDRFRQVDVRQDTLIGGTGLGLNISHNLISLMNGRIEVASIEGKGSTFKVILPKKGK